jgi:demethylmenaquinone methyltransferase/2-methoxy-6-polyprenyl-1,4-benzoquinol methylase
MSEETVSFGYSEVSPAEKSERVKAVFASVASRYDVMNDLMSAGVHRIWKAALIARLNPQPGEVLIDVAGGTGDIAKAFISAALSTGRRRGRTNRPLAIVADINEAMLIQGARRPDDNIVRVACDASSLPFADRTADAVTISFGIRNVVRIDDALQEFRRVLKPGGRFACLEFSHMTSPALQKIYDLYSFGVIPKLGELVAGDRASYQYLVESIRRFPDQAAFARRIESAGFSKVAITNFTGGVAALHTGWAY